MKYISIIVISIFFLNSSMATNKNTPADEYAMVQRNLASGWGTFDHRSVFNHVLLPDGLSLNLCFSRRTHGDENNYLKEAFISSRGGGRPEKITPGIHAYDDSYTALTCEWQGSIFKIESAKIADNIYLLVTPIKVAETIPAVVLEIGMLWNREGIVKLNKETISVQLPTKNIIVRSGNVLINDQLPTTSKYMISLLNQPVAFYTGDKQLTTLEVQTIVYQNREKQLRTYDQYSALSETYKAMQSVIGWNIIYDASKNRVIYPVSRIWNQYFGGHYILFDWDTYFASYMASMENRELAYANAVEITKAITPGGFIPNFTGSYGETSYDRSQPPVGSLVFKELYRKYHEKWLLEYVFDDLMRWNRWWPENRDNKGLLCYGSNPVAPPLKSDFATHEYQGALYESLDNSPMYDNIPFNKQTNMLELADVGLMSYYVMDCEALATIATILGKRKEADELIKRGNYYRKNLSQLWDEKAGIYKNMRTDTRRFSERISPNNFYPMLAKIPTQVMAERMVKEHLMNPDEFYGEWMLPSIAKNDSAFKDQEYWRGRIWAPMNFLVYLGLSNYDFPKAKKLLAEKSERLMMENVKLNGYIYENYHAVTGNISNPAEGRQRGDNYYHWGALLGFIELMEKGYVENPMKPFNWK